MANKAAEGLRTKSKDQLKEQLLELRKESFNLRFQKASNQLDSMLSFLVPVEVGLVACFHAKQSNAGLEGLHWV